MNIVYLGRAYTHEPLIKFQDMPKLQQYLFSLVCDWENQDTIRPGSITFKETLKKINKNVRRYSFVCSKKNVNGNALFNYKRVWSFNSHLETRLLEFEPRWIEFFSFIRFVRYYSGF